MTAPTILIDAASIIAAPCRFCDGTAAVVLTWRSADSTGTAKVCPSCWRMAGAEGLAADDQAELRRCAHVVALKARLAEAAAAGIERARDRQHRRYGRRPRAA